MTLRSRLLVGLLGLVAVGLVVSNVVTYRALRTFLYNRVDQQLVDSIGPMTSQLTGHRGGPGGRGPLPLPSVPVGTWAAYIRADGTITTGVVGYYGDDFSNAPQPRYRDADLERTGPVTVPGSNGGRFRLLADHEPDGDAVVVAVPLHDVDQTLGKLIGIELLATLGVLVAVGLLARFLVRRGLRPLEDIGVTAGAIAAGDLSRRVEPADDRTEVGRLGQSLNSMLGQIESAFAAQQESESRLRRFIADASHELRTPLTSIRGYAELFRRGAAEHPEDLEKAMRRIEQEAARMGVLVDDLLLLARLDQGRPLEREPVDLARVAADAVDDARAVDPDRPIAFEAPASATVAGDDVRLRQVVGNLLTNARQHTPAGTPVRVRVATENGSAVLEVADEGPGLEADQAARVFERFYRAEVSRTRAHGGTGLGLAIVAAITEAHGGKVGVDTAPGQGARFRVELPLAVAGNPPSPDPRMQQEPQPSPQERR